MVRMDQQKTIAKSGSLEMKYNATATGHVIVMIKYNNEVLYSAVMSAREYSDSLARASCGCDDTLSSSADEVDFINHYMANVDYFL